MKNIFTVLLSLIFVLGMPACKSKNNMRAKGTGIREKDRWYSNPSNHHRYPVDRYDFKEITGTASESE